MKRFVALVVVSLLLIVGGTRCSPNPSNPPETHPAGNEIFPTASPPVNGPRPVNATRLTAILAEILAHPDSFKDRQVEVIGYFRGWDLLKEAPGAPPLTRSDWVIADDSGAIYVTGGVPQGLDPSSLADTNKIIRLLATVHQNQAGAYLQAISIEVLSPQ